MNRLYVVVALVLVLGGCGGDPPSAALPSPSPSPSTTPTTSAAPVMPEEAKEDSKEGAVAFVKYYVALINHAQLTGDSAGLRAASWSACDACLRVSNAIDQLYAAGGHIEGGEWRMHQGVARYDKTLRSWLVVARISYPRQISFEPTEPNRTFEGGTHTFNFQVQVANQWRVMSWLRVN